MIQRRPILKPLVEAFFSWSKAHIHETPEKSETNNGLVYCMNQEKFLKVFLDHGDITLDNNATDLTFRLFFISKKNWRLIDTVHGVKKRHRL